MMKFKISNYPLTIVITVMLLSQLMLLLIVIDLKHEIKGGNGLPKWCHEKFLDNEKQNECNRLREKIIPTMNQRIDSIQSDMDTVRDEVKYIDDKVDTIQDNVD